GCFEKYASADGLVALTKEAIKKELPENSFMLKAVNGDISKINGLTAFNAMRKGDKTGRALCCG
ncbi:MAG: ROK family protein, partial [Firmicutes bacterium]|nr:ROK family protein [Bacillota bacterium]